MSSQTRGSVRVTRALASVKGRTALSPWARRLERRRRLQHGQVGEAAPDDLQPHRQSIGREAGGSGRGGLAREVEGIAERGPADPVPRVLPPVLVVQAAHGKGGDAERRHQEQVELLEKWPHGVPVREKFDLLL